MAGNSAGKYGMFDIFCKLQMRSNSCISFEVLDSDYATDSTATSTTLPFLKVNLETSLSVPELAKTVIEKLYFQARKRIKTYENLQRKNQSTLYHYLTAHVNIESRIKITDIQMWQTNELWKVPTLHCLYK